MSAEDEGRGGPEDGVGSLGAEALRLVGALSGWATQHGAGATEGAEELLRHVSERAQGLAHGFEEHLATGAAECTWCPLCRTVHTIRELSPEVRTHLTSAVSSLVQAASALLSTPVGDPARGGDSGRRGAATSPGVQHIDLDGDDESDDHS